MASGRQCPTVVIVEPYRDIAVALEEVVSLAQCTPVTVGTLEEVGDLVHRRPIAIVVRVATHLSTHSPHATLRAWPRTARPMIVALVSSEEDAAEAERLGCDVILCEPRQVHRLYDTLASVAGVPVDATGKAAADRQ